MSTTSVAVSYRPVKIGFLIEDGSHEQFIKCCKINTLLWGGIYNPIIPVIKSNNGLVDRLINDFSVDVLLSFSESPEISAVVKGYPHLKNPHHISESIFYEDWRTKKKIPAYIDVVHLIDYYWNKDFKHTKEENSNCIYATWDAEDALNSFFTVMFGAYPDDVALKTDYVKAFKNGLNAKTVKIINDLDGNLLNKVTPIYFTRERLGNPFHSSGLYLGDSGKLSDLVLFWNLRACGIHLMFLPINAVERVKGYATTFIRMLDGEPSRHPNFEDWIITYYSEDNKQESQRILNSFSLKKNFSWSRVGKNNWHVMSNIAHFDYKSILSIVENKYGRLAVTVPLSDKPFSAEKLYMQSYVISFNPRVEFEYAGFTLRPPHFSDLNEFYGQKIAMHPWSIRVENEGVGLIENMDRESVSLFPIKIEDMIIKVFERAGIKAKVSCPGRIASLIIKRMGGIEDCRVFKIRGVRKLLKECSSITWGAAGRIILGEQFDKFKDLYIEERKSRKLSPNDVIQFLIKKKILVPIPTNYYRLCSIFAQKKEFACDNCGYRSKVSVLTFQSDWKCPFCNHEHYLPLYIRRVLSQDKGKWLLMRGGLFAKENNQEGSLPVILTLLQLKRLLDSGGSFDWITSLELNFDQVKCEVDFVAMHSEFFSGRQELQITIGECKAGYDEIDDKNVQNFLMVKDKLEQSGIKCYLSFSKTKDNFLPSEIKRFKYLASQRKIPILLTNLELEPYEPYWEHPKEKTLPHKYVHTFREIADNSKHVYLE